MLAPLTAVTHELRCIGCGYVLRGLPVTARCPECGTLVMHTLVETLDMPSQALARPLHARRIARALIAVGGGILLWLVGVTAPLILRGAAELRNTQPPTNGGPGDRLGIVMAFLGVLIFALGSIQLARRDDPVLGQEIGGSRRVLLFGVGIWLSAAAASIVGILVDVQAFTRLSNEGLWYICLSVELVGSVLAATGLNKFATVLGRRCRRFRHAGIARQSLETMVIAGAIALVSSFSAAILPGLGYPDLAIYARIISFVTGGLLLMGGVYLVVNFVWIYRILYNPPPQIEDVIKVIGPLHRGESAN